MYKPEGNKTFCFDSSLEILEIPEAGHTYEQREALEAAGITAVLPNGSRVTYCLNRHDFRVDCQRQFTAAGFTGYCALSAECPLGDCGGG